jgi:hypothetical protein
MVQLGTETRVNTTKTLASLGDATWLLTMEGSIQIGNNPISGLPIHHYYKKCFIVSAVKSFFIWVSPADTILRIQKIDHF